MSGWFGNIWHGGAGPGDLKERLEGSTWFVWPWLLVHRQNVLSKGGQGGVGAEKGIKSRFGKGQRAGLWEAVIAEAALGDSEGSRH